MNNLIISYDLKTPGQDYERIYDAIKKLGNWTWLQQSVWYVDSRYDASQAAGSIYQVLDRNDSLFVVDSTNNSFACYNIDEENVRFLQKNWMRR